jgi:hypothetical protein
MRLALALLVVLSAAMQVPSPEGVRPAVFRAGVYVVPIGLVLNSDKKPWVGLGVDDFLVVLDHKDHPPMEVTHDEAQPNRYTLYFKPPDDSRDGRSHRIEIKVKKRGDWRTLPTKWSVTLSNSK